MTTLDSKLVAVLALYRGTEHDGERDNAKSRATLLARRIGLTFDEALAIYDRDAAAGAYSGRRPSTGRSEISLSVLFTLWRTTLDDDERDRIRLEIELIAREAGTTFQRAFDKFFGSSTRFSFDDIDDYMEAANAGYKRQRASEKRDKASLRSTRRKTVLARFGGSREAALAPCPAERILRAAVERWREPDPDNPRWTLSVAGWSSGPGGGKMPADVASAMNRAIPLPRTFREAEAEWSYWRERDLDMGAVMDRDGDLALDEVAAFRMRLVEDLIETDLPAQTLADLAARARFYRKKHDIPDEAAARILDDVEALAAEAREPVRDRGQIADAIRADPSRTDRAIAREFGCSPTTVGKVRAEIGLKGRARTVVRGGQRYEGRYGPH